MKITLLASLLVMAAYFLLLYAGVGLIQEKKFFSSAPREVFAAPQLFGYNKKRILRTFCSTSPSPPPSRGFARFFEVQFHIKI